MEPNQETIAGNIEYISHVLVPAFLLSCVPQCRTRMTFNIPKHTNFEGTGKGRIHNPLLNMGRSSVASKIDPLYLALLHQRHRDFERCAAACTRMLEANPADEAAWSLKTRALTAQVMVDDIEGDVDEGIVDLVLDDNALRAVSEWSCLCEELWGPS